MCYYFYRMLQLIIFTFLYLLHKKDNSQNKYIVPIFQFSRTSPVYILILISYHVSYYFSSVNKESRNIFDNSILLYIHLHHSQYLFLYLSTRYIVLWWHRPLLLSFLRIFLLIFDLQTLEWCLVQSLELFCSPCISTIVISSSFMVSNISIHWRVPK